MLSLYIVSRMILDFPGFKWAGEFLKKVYLQQSMPTTKQGCACHCHSFKGATKDLLVSICVECSNNGTLAARGLKRV